MLKKRIINVLMTAAALVLFALPTYTIGRSILEQLHQASSAMPGESK